MESVRRAAVVATTRTGSTWFGSLLDSHPEIRFHGEIFNLERAAISAVLAPGAYLNEVLAGAGPQRVLAFKLLYHQARLAYLNGFLLEMEQGRPSQVDWRALFPVRPVMEKQVPELARAWDLIRDCGTRIIHLRRRNLLRRCVSHEILMATSRARWKGVPVAPLARVRLPADRLIESFEEMVASAAEVDRFFTGNPRLVVYYEDLTADLATQCARALDFLAVRSWPLTCATRGRHRRTLRDTIENYDQVERALAGTPWEVFLDDR
jgi:LPS sulfotransferase NodH